MAIHAHQLEQIRATAVAVHEAVRARHGSTEGHCKATAVALALALAPVGEPVAICHGEVELDGRCHGHVWCRIGHTLIDATADQFGFVAPLVGDELDHCAYQEHGHLVFSPREAWSTLEILGSARPNA